MTESKTNHIGAVGAFATVAFMAAACAIGLNNTVDIVQNAYKHSQVQSTPEQSK